MIVKAIQTERYQDYRVPAMFIACSKCTFKCDRECGKPVCQNSELAQVPDKTIDTADIIYMYTENPITQSIIFGGLEPLDQTEDIVNVASQLRQLGITDDVVIYTGYTEEEVCEKTIDGIPFLEYAQKHFAPLVIKYGRYVPNQQPHYDEVLGVTLASDNQYARRYE